MEFTLFKILILECPMVLMCTVCSRDFKDGSLGDQFAFYLENSGVFFIG